MNQVQLEKLSHEIKRFGSILQRELEIKNRERELKTRHSFFFFFFGNISGNHLVDTDPDLFIA